MSDTTRPMPPPDLLGGRYLLAERIGRGGMASVYRATDQVLGRQVAVKVLELGREDAEVAAARFRREARATAALSHPGIVTVFDSGVDGERAYIVMELLPGATLADELRAGPLPVAEVESIAFQVCAALTAAHAAGIVHRDIKPANIARTADGGVKVVDFGITRIVDEVAGAGHAPLTVTGAVIGTAAYLAPEQATGGPVDHRADLYALGCVLFALLTGRAPYQGPTSVATLMAHTTEPVPDVAALRPDVPPRLAAVVTALMAKRPEDRPSSADDVAAALRAPTPEAAAGPTPTVVLPAALAPAPVVAAGGRDAERPGRLTWLLVVVAAALLGGGTLWWALQDRGAPGAGESVTQRTTAPPASASPTPTTAAPTSPPASTPAVQPTSAAPTTKSPRPSTSPPTASTPAHRLVAGSDAARRAAVELGRAVSDAADAGTVGKDTRKAVDKGLRDLDKGLRKGDDQAASDALSAIDQALSDSGRGDDFERLYDDLKDAVDAWKDALG